MPHQMTISKEMKNCAQTCLDCYQSCVETTTHCLQLGGDHAEFKHINVLQLCAEICELSAKALLSGSDYHADLCEACAKLCDACAESCESMDDKDMKACAKICRECSDSCKEIVKEARSSRKSFQKTVTDRPAHT